MARGFLMAAVAALLLALPATGEAASPLAGTWVAKRVGGRVLPHGYHAELRFTAHRFTGRSDCNYIQGRYRAGARTLRFREVVSSAMGCEHHGAAPPNFNRALFRTRRYRLTSNRLLLLGASGRTLARLARHR